MQSHAKHVAMIKTIATNLKELLQDSIFVGGSAVGFLITDRAAPDVRPTLDVDVVVGISTVLEYHRLEEKLRDLGFKDVMDVICRWSIDDVIVDIMPDNQDILGFSSSWYRPAMKHAIPEKIDEDLEIMLISAPYFLATKIDAFYERGNGNFLTSHDMEDIIVVINGREEISEEIRNSDRKLKKYLSKNFSEFLKNDAFNEAVLYTLAPNETGQKRRDVIIRRIDEIIEKAA